MTLTNFDGLDGFRPTKHLGVHQREMWYKDFSDIADEIYSVLKILYKDLNASPALQCMVDDILDEIHVAKPNRSQLELAVSCSCCERKKPCQTLVIMGDSTEAKFLTNHFATGTPKIRFGSSYVNLILPRGKITTLCEWIWSDDCKNLFSVTTREKILRSYVAAKCRGLRLDREADLVPKQEFCAPVKDSVWSVFGQSVLKLADKTIHELLFDVFRHSLDGRERYFIEETIQSHIDGFRKDIHDRVKKLYKEQHVTYNVKARGHFSSEIESACTCIRRKSYSAYKDALTI
jgi:hypothetical protein